jgi:lipopolysaccharide/colanic/teichoic acid biosynthesis glycosyltransferase
MFINVLKGQMKLVGVRPLSRSYFKLYTPEMQALHVSVKPGLLPPFYYDKKTPETLEEIQESEKRYIEAYHQHPFATDWRYFWGTVGNILFKHKRSH